MKKFTKIGGVKESHSNRLDLGAMKCENISSFFTLQSSLEKSQITRIGQQLKERVGKMSKAIAARVMHSSDPTINERRDRWGNVYYQVYDPRTQKSAVFGSELEIRYWLEQRYAR
jgi:hypothetical protein